MVMLIYNFEAPVQVLTQLVSIKMTPMVVIRAVAFIFLMIAQTQLGYLSKPTMIPDSKLLYVTV